MYNILKSTSGPSGYKHSEETKRVTFIESRITV